MLQSPSAGQILAESIIFGSIGLVLFLGRLWSRAILRNSWKNLVTDDYVMIFTFSCYVSLLVLINVSEHFDTNEYLKYQEAAILADPKEIERRIYGSKIVVGSNQAYLFTLWGVKACLLMLYYQLTTGTRNRTYVIIVAAYSAVGLLATEISLFAFCRPFSQYWAMPVENHQCSNYHDYCIVQTCFNISSDLLILAIPIPMILRVQVNKWKRVLLIAIFSLGLFTVLASILNKYYNFTLLNTTVYMIWHIRETSTSVFVANMMCWWPLLRKIFGLKRFLQRSSREEVVDSAGVKRAASDASNTTANTGVALNDRKTYVESAGKSPTISSTREVRRHDDLDDLDDRSDIEVGQVRVIRIRR